MVNFTFMQMSLFLLIMFGAIVLVLPINWSYKLILIIILAVIYGIQELLLRAYTLRRKN